MLRELDLDADLLEYAWTDEVDQAVRASHQEGIDRVGQDVGTPVIAVEGTAFFGPVISPAPKGQEAVDLWDGSSPSRSTPVSSSSSARGRSVRSSTRSRSPARVADATSVRTGGTVRARTVPPVCYGAG